VALPNVADYLPDPTGKEEMRLPERDFFYKVLYSLHPEVVDDLIKQAAKDRQNLDVNLQEQRWTLGVNKEWIDQLLLHDFQSSKCSIILNILIQPRREEASAASSSRRLARRARANRRESSTMGRLRRSKKVRARKKSITMRWLVRSARTSSSIPTNASLQFQRSARASMAAGRRGTLGNSSRIRIQQ
jgi:hypothetical protein